MPSIGSQLAPDAGHGRADFVIGDCFGTTCAPYISDAIENTIAGFAYIVARNKPFAGASLPAVMESRRTNSRSADRNQSSTLHGRTTDRKEQWI